jgi:signal transduction histidine kinase/HAMP domain-containing protein
MLMPKIHASVRTTLFAALMAMCLTIAVQGYYGYDLLSATGAMVIDMFDRPLMAINYARAANIDFAQIERKTLERSQAPADKRAKIDADTNNLLAEFAADLRVAEERSPEADELHVIGKIKSLVGRWTAARRVADNAEIGALTRQIDDAFDILIELNTDHSYIKRRQSIESISKYRYFLIGGLAASLILALAIGLFLSRRIMRPLTQAAAVANRIAAGEFQTTIPTGGSDETGVLLRSMTAMQDNIRIMVEHESERANSAQSRLVDALEVSDEGVVLVDGAGRTVLVNHRLRTMFPGIAQHFGVGVDYALITSLVESQLVPYAGDAGAKETTSQPVERQLRDGRWIRMSVSRASDNGRIIFFSDFTQIKEREESYKLAKHEAEAASAAKSSFLANMSHELRTPLNAIIGFSEIMSAQTFGALGSPRYVEYTSDILNSGRHLLDVINSVLDLSKSQAGKLAIDATDVDLNDVLGDCLKMIAGQCAQGGLKLDVRNSTGPLPVRGDEAKLRQIFLNLLSNAIKFTGKGGRISLSVAQADSDIDVSISDTGIGMSSQDIQVALTPFGQVDNRLERKYDGTGLGLPITKSFVELHGGTLRIESAVGRGTTVTVRLRRRDVGRISLRVAN